MREKYGEDWEPPKPKPVDEAVTTGQHTPSLSVEETTTTEQLAPGSVVEEEDVDEEISL